MAEAAARKIDRIDTAPRFTAADAHRLNNMFRGRDTQDMLNTALRESMLGDVAVVSSFGAESAVLLHLVAEVDPSLPVLFLDTGKHFAETLAYRDTLVDALELAHEPFGLADAASFGRVSEEQAISGDEHRRRSTVGAAPERKASGVECGVGSGPCGRCRRPARTDVDTQKIRRCHDPPTDRARAGESS